MGPESHSIIPRRVRCGLGPTAHWHESLSSSGVGVTLGPCVMVGDADAPGVDVGVAPTGVKVAHRPVPRQAACRTGSQPAGHPPSRGAAQLFSAHWQQSSSTPSVAVGVAVGPVGVGVAVIVAVTGVNVAHVPALKHAA